VVQHQDENVLISVDGEQPYTHRKVGAQIEALTAGRTNRFVHIGPVNGRDPKWYLNRIEQGLIRRAVHGREHRAQRLMPRHYVLQRRPQGVSINDTEQPQGDRNVVLRTSAMQPIQKPQPLLRER